MRPLKLARASGKRYVPPPTPRVSKPGVSSYAHLPVRTPGNIRRHWHTAPHCNSASRRPARHHLTGRKPWISLEVAKAHPGQLQWLLDSVAYTWKCMLARIHDVTHGHPTRHLRPPIIISVPADDDGVDRPITVQISRQIPNTRARSITKFDAVVKFSISERGCRANGRFVHKPKRLQRIAPTTSGSQALTRTA